jgi:hypothetical protein
MDILAAQQRRLRNRAEVKHDCRHTRLDSGHMSLPVHSQSLAAMITAAAAAPPAAAAAA